MGSRLWSSGFGFAKRLSIAIQSGSNTHNNSNGNADNNRNRKSNYNNGNYKTVFYSIQQPRPQRNFKKTEFEKNSFLPSSFCSMLAQDYSCSMSGKCVQCWRDI